ncbi:hypothetical protein CLOP_g2606 [Closterium sp. NIES-67]|nr:hypothetical protein CLOP_g2606 [Closterium sp. NIES-67]
MGAEAERRLSLHARHDCGRHPLTPTASHRPPTSAPSVDPPTAQVKSTWRARLPKRHDLWVRFRYPPCTFTSFHLLPLIPNPLPLRT